MQPSLIKGDGLRRCLQGLFNGILFVVNYSMFRNNNLTSLLELIPGTMEHKDKRLRELEERLERSSINNVIPECPVI